MTIGWHPPSGSQFRYNVNQMSRPFGCQTTGWPAHPVYIITKLWTGWGCHPVLIFIKNIEPDEHIRFSDTQIGKITDSPSIAPKPQINYSNHQYHLLITNKHHKLITLCFFEGWIQDFDELKDEDTQDDN